MKTLVIGYGSSGRRHARLLAELGCEVAVLSRRQTDFSRHYTELPQALEETQPEYVVVADRTSEHHGTMASLARHGYRGRVLIEKPIFDRFQPVPVHEFSCLRIGYNLRCHPLINRLRAVLEDGGRAVTASVYVGSYLPDWRPDADYRDSYSASKAQGGGALRDLSHELDYVLWLFGPWRRMTALGGRFGSLEIDSDDAYVLLMQTERCRLVSIHVNYLDRMPRREIVLNTERHTVHVDLVDNTIVLDGVRNDEIVARDDTYRLQHQALLDGRPEDLCTLDEAMETLATIDAAERAAASYTWLTRSPS